MTRASERVINMLGGLDHQETADVLKECCGLLPTLNLVNALDEALTPDEKAECANQWEDA